MLVLAEVLQGPTQKMKRAPQLMTLYVQTCNEETTTVSLPRSASLTELVEAIEDLIGIPSDDQHLVYEGQFLDLNPGYHRLSEYGITDWETIVVMPKLSGLKPVMYLFSPLPIDALVRVSLVKAWSFSVVYPDGPIKDSEFGQSITWNVKTHHDHTLTDMSTGTRVSYLFWETR